MPSANLNLASAITSSAYLDCPARPSAMTGGLAVHIGARIGALAAPGEVLVSGTLRDLVLGSGIEFSDRGVHGLKGIPRRLVPVRPWLTQHRPRH